MSLDHDPVLPLPHQPGILMIHLLNQCNLFCKSCYLDAAPWHTTYLPVELIIDSLAEVASLDIAKIYLTGGEPFLYPRLSEVLTLISRQENLQLYVSTNGTLISTVEAELLKQTEANVQVSVDGPEMYHDEVRGSKGAFHRTSRGIQLLTAIGVPVAIVITVCKDNLESLPWLAEWALEMGIKRISVQPLLQLGRGFEIQDRKLSQEQLCDLFLQLSDLAHAYRPRGLSFGLACRTRHFLLEHPCAAYVCDGTHCHRKVTKEIKKLVIREDGTVFPEIPTLDRSFALGSLYEGSLSQLVAEYFNDGYAHFDYLCRTVYNEILPTWTSPIIPWNEIVSERSMTFKSLKTHE